MRRALLAVALSVAGSWSALPARAADRVIFNDGNVLDGVVEEETDAEVVVRVATETRRYPRRLVRVVEHDARLNSVPAPASEGAAKPAGGAADGPARAVPADAAPARAAERPADAPAAKAPASHPGAASPAASDAPPVKDAPVDGLMLLKIAEGTPAEQGAAIEVIAAGWPVTRSTVEAALHHDRAFVRLAAVGFLTDARVTDATAYVPDLLGDADPAVRRAAVRVVRRLVLADLESRLVSMAEADPDRQVRVEALRSLEDVGTTACLRDVLRILETSNDTTLKPRLLRVLVRITGENRRNDSEAWHAAIDRAIRRAAEKKPVPAAK